MTDNQTIVRLLATLDNGDSILEHADGRLERVKSRTDWDHLRALSDDEIERNAADDPDSPPLDEAFFRAVRPVDTIGKTRITMFVDDDILRYFRGDGVRGYQTRINAILRRFVEAKR
jgi:uncharacterized protein (DUF4415 family)